MLVGLVRGRRMADGFLRQGTRFCLSPWRGCYESPRKGGRDVVRLGSPTDSGPAHHERLRPWTTGETRVGSSLLLMVAWPRVVGRTQRMMPFWTFLSRSMASRTWEGSTPENVAMGGRRRRGGCSGG